MSLTRRHPPAVACRTGYGLMGWTIKIVAAVHWAYPTSRLRASVMSSSRKPLQMSSFAFSSRKGLIPFSRSGR